MSTTREDFIRWFMDIGLTNRPSVGGKGASLGELMRADFAIPDGFVVTTAAFEAFIKALHNEPGIVSRIGELDPQDLNQVTAVTDDIRQHIDQTPMPDVLDEAITTTYAELDNDIDEPVAVRSSATSEDSEEASFAGLQDTYLWVKGKDAVARSVRSCWASLYSPESVSYRLRLQLPEEQLAMGVVVQRMVDSRCAGVMFTRSPMTGDRSVVTIEGSWGLGSTIVSGEVTPDKFVVNKITGEIMERTIACKRIEHVPVETGGTLEREVEPKIQNQTCLTDPELHTLVDIARKVEAHYGVAQDIEWAIDREHARVLLLQSRPETVWSSKESAPVATPSAKPFDHIFSVLGGQKKS